MRPCSMIKSKIMFVLRKTYVRKLGMLLSLAVCMILFTVILSISQLSPQCPKTRFTFNKNDLCSPEKSIVHYHSTTNNNKSVVIWVNSARQHFLHRELIRQTWGSFRSYNNITILAVVFMLGNADKIGEEETDVTRLETEILQFQDIIIGDFVDTYRNLSRKSIMALEWLTTFCQDAEIIVKTDDDIVVNIFKLTEELNAWSPTDIASSKIWCGVHWNEGTVKDIGSQFYVAPGTFENDIFPKHCAGLGWITPMGVIVRIMNEITKYFPGRILTHEDVFVTGIVPAKINEQIPCNEPIQYVDKYHIWHFLNLNSEDGEDYKFLLEVFKQPPNITENYDVFRKRFESYIFFLLNHMPYFEERFRSLWQIIEKTFRN